MSTSTERHGPSAAGTIVVLAVALLLANVFASLFVGSERYVYFWDWSGYWLQYRDLAAKLLGQPLVAVRESISSVRSADYNILPITPLLPVAWVFGNGRLPYVLAIVNVSLFTGAVLLGLVLARLARSDDPRSSGLALIFGASVTLLLHATWIPALKGLPDVIGVVLIAAVLLLAFGHGALERGWKGAATIGLLLCVLVLMRRWYVFWVIAFFPAFLACVSWRTENTSARGLRAVADAARRLFTTGVVFVVALFIVATPFAVRAVTTNYSDAYSAYRLSTSAWEFVERFVAHFGLGTLACAAIGWALLASSRSSRSLAVFLLIQSALIFVLFSRTQDFGVQHYYLLVPALVISIAALPVHAWHRIRNRLFGTVTIVGVFALLLANAAVVFSPSAAAAGHAFTPWLPTVRSHPFVRDDLGEIERIVDRLDALHGGRRGPLYVVASSETFNSSILNVACRTSARPRSFCGDILVTHDVDKRDGFPDRFGEALYVLVADPAQHHLRPEDQRVVGELASALGDGQGLAAAYDRLPDVFALDGGVKVSILVRRAQVPQHDLDALRASIAANYPGHRLFGRN